MAIHQIDSRIEDSLKERLEQGPFISLRMDLINKCNLRCQFCYYSDPKIAARPTKTVSLDTFDHWFRRLGPNIKELLLSCGDEPFMAPRFVEILKTISTYSDSLDVGLCTNAMLMNSSIRAALIDYGLTFIIFSMDGATKKTLERIRVKSDYERIVGNIKALKTLRDRSNSQYPKFLFNYVIMRSNIHETLDFLDICKKLDADLVDFRHVVPTEYWNDEGEKLGNYPHLFNAYRERILAKAKSLKLDVVISPPMDTDSALFTIPDSHENLLEDFNAAKEDDNLDLEPTPKRFAPDFESRKPLALPQEFFADSYCERPFTEIVIRNQKEAVPCPWHGKVLGELDEETDLKSIFLGEGFANLRATMLRGEVAPACSQCPVKSHLLPTTVISGKGD